MIPVAYIQEWSTRAPWPDSRQVEQDLIICRALCDLFNDPFLAQKIAFRGGTAINKLLFRQPLRYSEDIDLIQTQAEPIGPTVKAIGNALSWLGKFNWSKAEHSIHLVFKFVPEADAATTLKLKVEINTREHASLYGVKKCPFAVDSGWYKSETKITSFEPEELFGTKLRALLQRRKNRDLFDLNQGLGQLAMEPAKIIACFEHYLAMQGISINRAAAEQRMLQKLNKSLTEDISLLLPVGITFTEDEAIAAFEKLWFELIVRIKGEPWKLSEKAIEDIRKEKKPTFLHKPAG
ncbi:MAG TPA: nucleotidyl transferase AbiEii/AbiGii toxin family protein [Candidatus Saccharimonadales bacterium]|nr:nucleotidyl transferase AbiEii/AbiGii toxin family protein [Candidatus Saccharimonadales bacterium]